MAIPSKPEMMPRELTLNYRSYRPYRRPSGFATRSGYPRACSIIERSIADPKRYVTPPPPQGLSNSSPPSTTTLLTRCLGKKPARSPSRFMTLDSPSSSVMEGAVAGPSCFNGSFEGPSSARPSSS
ncbi:hypothetical protein M422DRAFT_249877 [Sphaerobolus stellatus SS14]|uniref:Uncharacterized protein n=1 Tax=Sphaerobolus stellatus (strain SS14) TaxID=990650 RepID=A0A0C9W3Q8_SPHS4|nr:hypothetical protein M422DRAFT_249877 [Sphaerobolus stellatus SS14]